VFAEMEEPLKDLFGRLKESYGQEPSDDELAAAIEMEFQDWLVGRACPTLKLNQHGCLAVASIVARQMAPKGQP
jgi:hypothetical protein